MKSTPEATEVTLVKMQSTQFMTAVAKGRVLQAWERFLKSGLKKKVFSEPLYRHITMNCSFCAYFNREGFYAHFFSEPNERTLLFLEQFDPEQSGACAERGDTMWLRVVDADLNLAMRQVAGKYMKALVEKVKSDMRDRELALADALFAKHDTSSKNKDARALVRKLVDAVKQWAPPRLAQDGDYIDRPGLDLAMQAAEKFLKETT